MAEYSIACYHILIHIWLLKSKLLRSTIAFKQQPEFGFLQAHQTPLLNAKEQESSKDYTVGIFNFTDCFFVYNFLAEALQCTVERKANK